MKQPDPQDRPDREKLAELDKQAWNLPGPPLVPVGPLEEHLPAAPEDVADDEPRGDKKL